MAEITGDLTQDHRAIRYALYQFASWASAALVPPSAAAGGAAAGWSGPRTLCKEEVRQIFLEDLRQATDWQLRHQQYRVRQVPRVASSEIRPWAEPCRLPNQSVSHRGSPGEAASPRLPQNQAGPAEAVPSQSLRRGCPAGSQSILCGLQRNDVARVLPLLR